MNCNSTPQKGAIVGNTTAGTSQGDAAEADRGLHHLTTCRIYAWQCVLQNSRCAGVCDPGNFTCPFECRHFLCILHTTPLCPAMSPYHIYTCNTNIGCQWATTCQKVLQTTTMPLAVWFRTCVASLRAWPSGLILSPYSHTCFESALQADCPTYNTSLKLTDGGNSPLGDTNVHQHIHTDTQLHAEANNCFLVIKSLFSCSNRFRVDQCGKPLGKLRTASTPS
jgi:hypothetical protein